MSDYARLRLLLEVAENASYYNGEQQQVEVTLTPDEWTVAQVYEAVTGGTTISLSNLDSCTGFVIENKNATYPVLVQWYTQLGTQANPGGAGYVTADANPDTIVDGAAGGTFVTNGAEAGGYVRCLTSEDAANDGAHLIQTAAINTLTLGAGEALVANAQDTTMTLSFEKKNKARVAASGVLAITDRVVTAGGLVLTGVGGTAKCKISYFGT